MKGALSFSKQGNTTVYNILVCDDEKDIVSALKIYLSSDEYNIFEAYNGEEAINTVISNEIHLVLMDIMMPKVDGLTALIKIREHKNIPVILLTAKSEDTDKILGLNIGADDYITKPFNPLEVQARVRSQLRRYMQLGSGAPDNHIICIGGITLNDKTKEVTADGNPVTLTPTEYDILKLLIKNPGVVFSPSEIYTKIWNEPPHGAEGTIAVHIRHLREKIEITPADPRYIKVIWGQGYKFEAYK